MNQTEQELLNALRRIVLFESGDPDFIAELADESASRGENASTSLWRERLLEDAQSIIAKIEGN